MGYYDESKRKYVNKYIKTSGLRNTPLQVDENALLMAEIKHRLSKIQLELCDTCLDYVEKQFKALNDVLSGLEG